MAWWDVVTGGASKWLKRLKKLAKKAKEKVEEVVEDVGDDVKDFVSDVADTWQTAWRHITNCNSVGSCVLTLVTGVVAGIVGTIGNIVDLLCDAWGWVSHAIGALVGIVVGGLIIGFWGSFIPGSLGDLLVDVGTWVMDTGAGIGSWISDRLDDLGDIVEMAADLIAVGIMTWARTLTCWVGVLLDLDPVSLALATRNRGVSIRNPKAGFESTNHFFVLMLENRSFDHMLGHWDSQKDPDKWLVNPGVDGIPPGGSENEWRGVTYRSGNNATNTLSADPPHEFDSVRDQIGVNEDMSGFVKSFGEKHTLLVAGGIADPGLVMQGFTPQNLPFLHHLGYEFAICDRWYSSLPGPTQPNRLFVHAATSGGLADSASSNLPVGRGLRFENGTLFELLSSNCLTWRVYSDGAVPMVLMLAGIEAQAGFSASDLFAGDVQRLIEDLKSANDDFPEYIFIEPDYGEFFDLTGHADFSGGNSQHPLSSASAGDKLIRDVYEALVASPIWRNSAFIITYDEHGGFFDHRKPPSAEPPGDRTPYRDMGVSSRSRNFAFDRLGVRVPAVVVSPYIAPQTVDSRDFDHSSVIATVATRFGLGYLTERDRHANTLEAMFSRTSPRLPGGTGSAGCPQTLGRR